jgi:hypothetical protein
MRYLLCLIAIVALATACENPLSLAFPSKAKGPGPRCERTDRFPMVNAQSGDTVWTTRRISVSGPCPAIVWWQSVAPLREPED